MLKPAYCLMILGTDYADLHGKIIKKIREIRVIRA